MTDHTPTVAEMREYITRLQGTGGSLSRALSESVGEWFDRGIAQVKAEAWDEGRNAKPDYSLGHDEEWCGGWEDCDCGVYTNPYREQK